MTGGTAAWSDSRVSAIRSLVPESVRIAIAQDDEDAGPPHAEELQLVAHAVPARQHEFLLGRRCARAALAQLGAVPGAILVGANRAPIWPPGIVGSIAHCRGFVGAMVSRDEHLECLGFDAEPALPLGEELVTAVCTSVEIDWVRNAAPPIAADWPTVLFCAKEAIHKCIAPRSQVTLDFTDVTVVLDVLARTFVARLEVPPEERLPDFARIEGRYAIAASLVFTSAFIRSTASTRG